MKRIQRKLHTIGTCKIYLSCFDDKIYIVNDCINSLAYFHKDEKISEINKINKISRINQINRINRINRIYKNKSSQ